MDNLDVKFDTVKTLATKWTQFQRKLACWKFYPDQKPFLKQTFVHFKNNKDYFKHHFPLKLEKVETFYLFSSVTLVLTPTFEVNEKYCNSIFHSPFKI